MDPISYHKNLKGKIEVISRAKLLTKEDLSLAYTPGVAKACEEIVKDKKSLYDLTRKNNLVAVVTDGSAVLGLGNIGAEAGLPVMEGKCALFKEFADVDAFPIAIKTQETEEIIKIIANISPIFGGINLEDISAPRCFEIEEKLSKILEIPVFHDDQHGTAIVTLAGLMNALKVVGKKLNEVKVVLNGAGAAGNSIANLLVEAGVRNLLVLDSKGIILKGRSDLDLEKIKLAEKTNFEMISGRLEDAIAGADVFVGVSKAGVFTADMAKKMNKDGIIFALANPVPEIMPDVAKSAGVKIVATGRSDFPNQVNNVLVFPGVFRGLLDGRINKVTMKMKINVANALASVVKEPTVDYILPSPLDKNVSKIIAAAVQNFI